LWAVASHADKRGGRWDLDEFLATGRAEIAEVMQGVVRVGARGRDAALDFGCGVGRLTQALVQHYAAVTGVDIAASMIDEARRIDNTARCTFVVNARPDLQIFETGSFDLVCSSITLQHMEPRFMRQYLAEFVRVLAPGGVAAFQIPSAPPKSAMSLMKRVLPISLRRAAHWVRSLMGRRATMQMFWLSKAQVAETLTRAGGRVLHTKDTVWPDGWASVWYFVSREDLPAA
jgi:ubiquinone/menaquinone biosynthesis C-methylase UbiE